MTMTVYDESPSLTLNSNVKNINHLCEELLRNTTYNFNLPIDVLINNSTTSRLAVRNRKKKLNKIPRRQNAWIIYRRDKSASPEFKGKGLKSAVISKKIAEIWAKEPKEVVALFDILAKKSEEIHKKKYNGYEYKPQKKKERKTRNKKVPKNEEPVEQQVMSNTPSPEPEEPSRFPPTPSPDFSDEINFISNLCMDELERPEQQLSMVPLQTTPISSQEPLSPDESETYDESNNLCINEFFIMSPTTSTSPQEPISNLSTYEPARNKDMSESLSEQSEQRALPDILYHEPNIFISTYSPLEDVVDNIIFFSEEQSEDFLLPLQYQHQQHQHQQQLQQQPQDWVLYEESSQSRTYFSLGV